MQDFRGMPVVNDLKGQFEKEIEILKEKGVNPKLTVVRVGEREDDIAYEKGILKRFAAVNAVVEVITLPDDVKQEKLEETIQLLNHDTNVHGILLFRPLPKHLSEDRIKYMIDERKDVDCMGMANMAYLFSGNKNGYPPCTPQAVMEL